MLLALFALVVLAGAFLVVTQSPAPNRAATAGLVTDAGTPSPDATTSVDASPSVSSNPATTPPGTVAGTIVLAGPDLATLRYALAAVSGAQVLVADSSPAEVLAPHALDGFTATPNSVVLEVLAGTKTSARTTSAILTVHETWPRAKVYVIGPFAAADRKSTSAAKTAAIAMKAVFLDPVTLKWRKDDSTATLTRGDLAAVIEKLAAALR